MWFVLFQNLFVIVFSLSRFHGISMQMENVQNIEDIQMLIREIKKEMSLVSVSSSHSF